MPGAILTAKDYGHSDRDVGGIEFLNNEGSECGGLVSGNWHKGDHPDAAAALRFDQYTQTNGGD